jgi:pyrimidine deaminase RibD-like protein
MATGSCRAAAIGMNGTTEEILSGYSVKNSHHAEKAVIDQAGAWGTGGMLTMYVDIEPCSDGKYNGHSTGCNSRINAAFHSGMVWYTFKESEYSSGDLKTFLKDSDKQDQIVKLKSLAGKY